MYSKSKIHEYVKIKHAYLADFHVTLKSNLSLKSLFYLQEKFPILRLHSHNVGLI